MDQTLWGIANIAGPIILLVALIWLVMRSRRRAGQPTETTHQTERATDNLYKEEEQRRREGTDDL